jgi:hypothetical protein
MQHREGQPSLSLEIKAVRDFSPAGSKVLVKTTLINNGDHDLQVWRSTRWDYQVDIRDELGTLMPDTKPGTWYNGHGIPDPDLSDPDNLKYLTSSGGCVLLKRSQSFEDVLNVSALYLLNKPGKYRIFMTTPDEETNVTVKSNTITISLTQ